MLQPGRNRAKAGRLGPCHDGARQKRGRQIDFAHRPPEERIAQGAADDAGFLSLLRERGKNGAQGLDAEQGGKRPGRGDALGFCRDSLQPPRHKPAILDMGRYVGARVARREDAEGKHANGGGRETRQGERRPRP